MKFRGKEQKKSYLVSSVKLFGIQGCALGVPVFVTKSVVGFFGFLQRLPGFIHKDMETLFVEEQQSAINQLMANLESQPVTKGSSDSKYSMPFNRIKG